MHVNGAPESPQKCIQSILVVFQLVLSFLFHCYGGCSCFCYRPAMVLRQIQRMSAVRATANVFEAQERCTLALNLEGASLEVTVLANTSQPGNVASNISYKIIYL